MLQVVKLRERSSCALHETKKIPGDSNRRGSSAAEQNHSSVVSLFFGDKETKDCMEHVHVIIRYLFTRQKTHTNKFNKGLFGLCNERAMCLEQLEERKISNCKHYQVLKDGVLNFNFNAFKLFEKEVKQINYYYCIECREGDDDVFHVKRKDSEASPRKFSFKRQRCMCNFRLAQLMMRKHDIFLCQNHIPEHFEMQHVFRDSVTKSFTVGEQKEHSNKTTRTIQDGIVDSIQESEKTCPID